MLQRFQMQFLNHIFGTIVTNIGFYYHEFTILLNLPFLCILLCFDSAIAEPSSSQGFQDLLTLPTRESVPKPRG